ncbi:MAG: hypothetical protein BGO78_02845 [Chloroflexi bacterium 44-23]|nr:MAG: hypothetical protein BGO78_02845 [Chloroflexi bacterium 44-23]
MYMIMFVMDESSYLDPILDAWSDIGVTGATIVESMGLYRRVQKRIPMRYTYGEVQMQGKGNMTLFAIVADEALVNNCLSAVEKIVGDLDLPNTGVFSAWPLSINKGVSKSGKK